MTRTDGEKRADVRRLVEAARAVARDPGALTADLVRTTGLSPEGIALAFERHLELDPSDADLDALVAGAGAAKHVVVVLSANVFVAALRALAIARAASPSVVVRPSRREPDFARALVAHTRDPGLTLVEDLALDRLFGGEVHVYGRDATIADVRARVGERIRVRGHGAGMGVAVVTEGAAVETSGARTRGRRDRVRPARVPEPARRLRGGGGAGGRLRGRPRRRARGGEHPRASRPPPRR